jgi:hypothetical protein
MQWQCYDTAVFERDNAVHRHGEESYNCYYWPVLERGVLNRAFFFWRLVFRGRQIVSVVDN